MLGKNYARLVTIAVVFVLVLPGGAFIVGDDGGYVGESLDDSSIGEDIPREGTKGTPLEIISRDISIPAGKQYYVYYNSSTNTLREMKVPDLTAGLPAIALQAIDLSPTWLKDNLTRKLGQISETDIDVGLRSNPAIADIDGDGDLDLAVASNLGTISYYENVDDGYHYYEGYDYFINAVYVEELTLFSGVNIGSYGDPTFADLDNDGDMDMIAGNSLGELQFFNRTVAGWAAPVDIGLSVAGYSTPYLVDFEGDLDYDLFVGDVNGYLNYSENTGTPASPVWSALVNVQSGGVDIDVGTYSNPAAGDFFDNDGDIDLVIGANDGKLDYYRNDGAGVWTDVTSLGGLYATSIDIGDYSSPALADMDSNLVLDIVMGANTGNVFYRENIGSASTPRLHRWVNPSTGFDALNINDYYEDDLMLTSFTKLRHRESSSWLTDYSQMIIDVAGSPDTIKQLDELIFTIAHSSTTSLKLEPMGFPLVFPEVYRNNTEVLYFNDQFIEYANILDFNVGTEEQWSTVEYWMNESGKRTRYVHPRDIYYWYIVHPKLSDEVVTFIDPNVATWGHWSNAAQPPPTGKFWRWTTMHEADPDWPIDPPGAVKYPKVDLPPLLKDHLQGMTTMWDGKGYNAGAIYNNSGYDTGNRPWSFRDHGLEKVSQWVERTLPLNAQEDNDGNRPHQPVRIQWEHNGNCGELGDLTAAALRSALIPAIEHVSYPEDHCWNHFYERGWHGLDDQWSSGASVVAYNNYVRYWNRDWSAIAAHKGDSSMFDVSPWEHSIVDANNNGYQDRGNVTVVVKDTNGFPVDGVKIAVADWSNYGTYISLGTQWTYTNADGEAFFFTSESRQGDTYDDGLLIHASSKLGGGQLNPTYDDRFIICIEDPLHFNPANLPMYVFDSAFYGVAMSPKPRPHPQVTDTSYAGAGQYLLRAGFDTLYGIQHPPNGLGIDERRNAAGQRVFDKTYHDVVFYAGNHLDAFIADEANFEKFLKGEPFDANSTMFNESSGVASIDIPASGDWYFVLSNQDAVETSKFVNVTVELFDLPTFVPDSTVEPPTNLTIGLSGDNLENVTLSWDLSLDDPAIGGGEDDVSFYEIYYSRTFSAIKTNYTLLDIVPSGTSTYTHAYAGNGYIGTEWTGKDFPPDNFFYYVVAKDDDWNSANTTLQVAKSISRLEVGMNFASFPLMPIDTSTEAALQTVAFDNIWRYDQTALDLWRTYMKHKPYKGDLLQLDNTKGFLINVTEYSYLTVVGYPGEPIQINLDQGWNLVAYPSFTRRTVAEVLAGIPYLRVEGYDPSSPPWHARVYSDNDYMEQGYAYWVKVSTPSILTVNYY
jgi:hypothetical protein